MAKLSFSIAINLLTDNFKRGAGNVKNGLRAMQMQVLTFAAALGAGGLGLSNLVSRMIDTARETNRVTTALKNVSGSLYQFADSQRFLLDIAKKYGIEINGLTGSFAKFTASATNAGVSIENQKKIFESVSRSITAFGLSSDESNGVMLALSQMMGKGKINSEELRKQMGEKLPIAMQAMAKAAGVSQAGLEKLLKSGSLMAADILPKFADALNEMIPDVDTDNLETSINKLKNTVGEFVNGLNVQSKYKALIDFITEQVQNSASKIKSIVASLVAVISGALLGRLFKWIIAQLAIAQRQAMIAAARAARASGQAFDETAWRAQSASATIRTAFMRTITAIRTAFMSMLPTALFTIIAAIISKMVLAHNEAKRIKNLFNDYENELSRSTNTEIARLENLKKIADDTKGLKEKHGLWTQIGTLMGEAQRKNESDLDYQIRINKKYDERIKLLKSAAEIDYLYRKKLETEDQIKAIQSQSKKKAAGVASGINNEPAIGSMYNPWSGPLGVKTLWNVFNPFNGLKTSTDEAKSELDALGEILSDVNSKLEGVELDTAKIASGGAEDGKKSSLQKAEEKYAESLKEYNNQLASGAITQQEYNKSIEDLSRNTVKDIGGILGDAAKENKTFIKALAGLATPLSELEKVQKEYNTELGKLNEQKKNGVVTEKEYEEELNKLIEKTIKTAGSIEGIGIEGQAFIAALMFNRQLLESSKNTGIKPNERDTTFDYKKTNLDIKGEELKIAEEYVNELKKAIDKGAKHLEEQFNAAMGNVKDLKTALKLAEVQEDIKKLSKELNEGFYDGVKNIASSSDQVVSAFSNLRDVMNDVDASGWERIMAIWNSITTLLDSFLSIIKMIETLTEVTSKLKAAKEAEAAIDTTVTGIKATNAMTEAAAEAAAATIKVGASHAVSAAATTQMAAESTAAYAYIPFAGVALAGAQIAAMEALIAVASIPKFAGGGIVPGNSYSGDKVLAGVNSGEMILNQGQQSRLFRMLNSGSGSAQSANNSMVEFRISGTNLVGVINNYNNRKNKIR